MRGFTDKALILLSDVEEHEHSSSVYKYDYRMAVHNIIDYLRSNDIKHYCLLTDPLATCIDMEKPVWLATGTPEDLFFMRNYCGVPTLDAVNMEANLSATIRKKFPIARGLSPQERYPIVAKRVQFAEKELIKLFSFVVVFGKTFKVPSKPGDGKAILRVNEKKFYTSMELGGEAVPINDFMQIPYANQCLSKWGVYRVKC